MPTIKIKLGELMAQEAVKRGQRSITIKQMSEEMNSRFGMTISRNTLSHLSKGAETGGILWKVLIPLCLYFDCQPGDLIKLDK